MIEGPKQHSEPETVQSIALVPTNSTRNENTDHDDLVHMNEQIDHDLDPPGNQTYITAISVDMRILTPRIFRYAGQVLQERNQAQIECPEPFE